MGAELQKRAALTLNGGSSSLKFALFRDGTPPARTTSGAIERIGTRNSRMELRDGANCVIEARPVDAPDHRVAVQLVLESMARNGQAPAVIGHRVVHGGMRFAEPCLVTPEVLRDLRQLAPYDPEHLPAEIAMIEQACARYPGVAQIACFDTGFHRDLPTVAKLLAIPRRYAEKGVRRYGFHGLSYTFLMGEIARLGGGAVPRRIVLAHLGNGASLAAVRDGVCIDTTMGFTPTGGLPMSTRSGDLDPGLVRFFADAEHMSMEQFHAMVNRESGLRGLSETGSDVRDLLLREAEDPRAAEALAHFCYHVRKGIGALCAALDGIDLLVFSGGIGENAPVIRQRICSGLSHLGLRLADHRNTANEGVLSADDSPVLIRRIHTDEELVIARAAFAFDAERSPAARPGVLP